MSCSIEPKYGELDAHLDLKLVVKGEVDDSGDRRLKSLYVEGIFHRYLELRECKPRLSKLRSILGENLFAGMSSIEAAAGPTTRQLLDRVQCSEKELQQGLPFQLFFNSHGSTKKSPKLKNRGRVVLIAIGHSS